MGKVISTENWTREEWLAARSGYIGASDSRKIFYPTDEYGTAVDVVRSKLEGATGEMNGLMRRGHRLEPVGAEMWAEQTGMKVLKDTSIRYNDETDKEGMQYIACNLDYVIEPRNGDGPGLLQIKVTSRTVFESWKGELPPPHYFQEQHEFLASGFTWGFIGVCMVAEFKDLEMVSIPVSPDIKIMGDMKWKLGKIWNEFVLERRLPPPETVNDVCRLYPYHTPGKLIEVDAQVADIASAYKSFHEQEKAGKNGKDDCKRGLVTRIGDAEGLTYGGRIICTYKADQRKAFDISALQQVDPELYMEYVEDRPVFNEEKFKAENPDAYKAYCKEVPGSRRFLVK